MHKSRCCHRNPTVSFIIKTFRLTHTHTRGLNEATKYVMMMRKRSSDSDITLEVGRW